VDEGLGLQQRALGLMEKSLGAQSPELAAPLHNMALTYLRLERPDEAVALVKRALELRRKGLGVAHAKTIESVYQLGYVEKAGGNLEAARAAFEEYLRLNEEHRPEDRESQVHALVGLADVALLQDEPVKAQAEMERALLLLGEGAEQAGLRVAVRFNLARALEARGREVGRARGLAEAALAEAASVPDEQREMIELWLAERTAKERGP
jgi:tetratricopeptide (TPR) repeat protein